MKLKYVPDGNCPSSEPPPEVSCRLLFEPLTLPPMTIVFGWTVATNSIKVWLITPLFHWFLFKRNQIVWMEEGFILNLMGSNQLDDWDQFRCNWHSHVFTSRLRLSHGEGRVFSSWDVCHFWDLPASETSLTSGTFRFSEFSKNQKFSYLSCKYAGQVASFQ